MEKRTGGEKVTLGGQETIQARQTTHILCIVLLHLARVRSRTYAYGAYIECI
jgi:hypothetical protein